MKENNTILTSIFIKYETELCVPRACKRRFFFLKKKRTGTHTSDLFNEVSMFSSLIEL